MKKLLLLLILISLSFGTKPITLQTSFGGAGAVNKHNTFGGGSLMFGMIYQKRHNLALEMNILGSNIDILFGGGVSYHYALRSPSEKLTFKFGGVGGFWMSAGAISYSSPHKSEEIDLVSGTSENILHFGGPSLKLEIGSKVPRFFVGSKLLIGEELLNITETGIALDFTNHVKKIRHPKPIGPLNLILRNGFAGGITRETKSIGFSTAIGVTIKQKHQLLANYTYTKYDGKLFGLGIEYGYRIRKGDYLTIVPALTFSMSFGENEDVPDGSHNGYQFTFYEQYWPGVSCAIEVGSKVPRFYVATKQLIGDGVANVTEAGLTLDFSKRRVNW